MDLIKLSADTPNPTDQYLRLIGMYQRGAKFIGMDIYRDDYKINPKIVLSCLYNVLDIFSFIYEIISGFNNRDIGRALQGFLFIGTMLQELVKTVNIIYNLQDLKQCHRWVIELSDAVEGPSKTTLQKINVFYSYFGPLTAQMTIAVSSTLSIYPIYAFLQLDKKEWIVPFFIPFVSRTTNGGYITLLVFQYLQTLNTGVKFSCTDTIFFYYLFFAGAYEELVEHKCVALYDAMVECQKTHKYPTPEMQQKFHVLLIDAIKANQSMDLYFEKIRFFEQSLLWQFGCLSYTLMLCIVLIKLYSNWFALYCFAGICMFELCMYSVIGTYIEAKFDRLPFVIYAIPWQLLSVPDQKIFMLFLQHNQKSKRLFVMGEKTCSVQTGQAIMKFIYSAYVMLDSFLS